MVGVALRQRRPWDRVRGRRAAVLALPVVLAAQLLWVATPSRGQSPSPAASFAALDAGGGLPRRWEANTGGTQVSIAQGSTVGFSYPKDPVQPASRVVTDERLVTASEHGCAGPRPRLVDGDTPAVHADMERGQHAPIDAVLDPPAAKPERL